MIVRACEVLPGGVQMIVRGAREGDQMAVQTCRGGRETAWLQELSLPPWLCTCRPTHAFSVLKRSPCICRQKTNR